MNTTVYHLCSNKEMSLFRTIQFIFIRLGLALQILFRFLTFFIYLTFLSTKSPDLPLIHSVMLIYGKHEIDTLKI